MGPNENKTTPVSESPAQPSNFENDFRSSLTSDIMIEPDKKPRRKLDKKVIVIIVLLIALAIIGVFALFSTGAVKLSKTNLGDVKTAYTRFANMVIDGKDSKDEIKGEYDISKKYYFNNATKTQEAMTKYIEDSKDARDNLNKVLNSWKPKEDNEQLQKIKKLAKDEIDIHDLFAVMYTKTPFDYKEFQKLYAEKGKDEAEKYLNEYYASDKKDNTYISGLNEKLQAAGKAIMENVDLYEIIDCDKKQTNHFCVKEHGDINQRNQHDHNLDIVSDFYNSLNRYADLTDTYVETAFDVLTMIKEAQK